MSEIRVPKAMFEAAMDCCSPNHPRRTMLVLEAALRWLTANPIVPTEEQFQQMCRDYHNEFCGEPPVGMTQGHYLPVEWQRRMFIVPEPESATNSRPLPRNHDDGRGRYKCPECGHILEPGGSFQSDCQSCVSIAYRIYLAKAYTAEHNGEPIPTPPRWTFLYPKAKLHGGSSIFDQGEDSLCAIRLKDETPEPEVPESIKDLLYRTRDVATPHMLVSCAEAEDRVIEAFRRGQQSKEGSK